MSSAVINLKSNIAKSVDSDQNDPSGVVHSDSNFAYKLKLFGCLNKNMQQMTAVDDTKRETVYREVKEKGRIFQYL